MINPNMNRMINPNMNRMVNPNLNRMINPNLNRMINPNLNRMINPNLNRNINPNLNYNFSGLFRYDSDLQPIAFVVNVDNSVIQIFDFKLKNVGFGVRHSQNGFLIFNSNNMFEFHWESDSQTGYNEFDLNNKWTGIIK
jgi:hypothetical protein